MIGENQAVGKLWEKFKQPGHSPFKQQYRFGSLEEEK